MEVLIGFILGLMVGIVTTVIISRVKSIGSLRVDYSDPDDGPYLWLELSSNPSVIERQKYVTLKVNTKSYISQK